MWNLSVRSAEVNFVNFRILENKSSLVSQSRMGPPLSTWRVHHAILPPYLWPRICASLPRYTTPLAMASLNAGFLSCKPLAISVNGYVIARLR